MSTQSRTGTSKMVRRRAVIDSSDESGNENKNDAATNQNGMTGHEADFDTDSSSTASESESDSDSSSEGGLVDDQAVEDKYAKRQKSRPTEIPYHESFPQFSRLPPELRSHIWELFCPDLASKHGRLLRTEAILVEPSDRTLPTHWELRPHGIFLEQQTAELRTVAAVNHESRSLVHSVFPDELPLHDGSGDAIVRFSGSRDVVGITDEFEPTPVIRQGSSLRRSVGPLCKSVKHVAFSLVYHTVAEDDEAIIDADFCNGMNDMLDKFPNAKSAYVWLDSNEAPFNDRWAGTPFANKYVLNIEEALEFKFATLTWIYAWPNVEEHPDFCKVSVIEPFRGQLDDESLMPFDKKGVRLLPLLSYGFDEEELAMFESFEEDYKAGVPVDGPSHRVCDHSDDDDDSSNATPDEYESDGIDDREMLEREPNSEDELLPGAVDAVDSSDTEAGGDDGTAGRTIPRGRKRRVVSDSDEDSDAAGPSTKRARRQPPQAELASDEDSSSDPPSSDSDDDNQPSAGPSARNKSLLKMFKNNEALSSESSSSEDSDDDQQPAPRLSLAERLQQFREEVPVPDDEDEGEDEGEVGFDYRTRMPTRGNSDGEPEEEGSVGVWSSEDEEDEGSDDEDGDGMIDGMAEDTEEGSEGGDSEE